MEPLQHFDFAKVIRFCGLLCKIGVDFVEMPAELYETLRFKTNGSFGSWADAGDGSNVYDEDPASVHIPLLLHIDVDGQMDSFPEIPRFVCRSCEDVTDARLIHELQLNDIREINRLHNSNRLSRVRLKGLDDILLKDYVQAFSQIQSYLGKEYEYCPQDSFGLATASAVEWISQGGSRLVTSFGGLGNCAPTEEVLMALRINSRHHPNHDMTVMPQLRHLFEEMTGTHFSPRKPILGSQIFQVEAGIHADGIDKDPYTYEPYGPESVGTARALVVGKHSGTKAIEIKMAQMEIPYHPTDLMPILRKVQEESIRIGRSLTDDEFVRVVRSMK